MHNFDDLDDFHIEDISKNKKKKKVNGKRKGNRTELELTKVLTAHFKSAFSRTVSSGARWAQASLPKHAMEIFSGDLIVPKGFKFAIESKGGYDSIDIGSIFMDGSKELDSFLSQAMEDANRAGRKPMLCWKRTRKPWISFILTADMPEKEFKYAIKYREWTGVALDYLLEMSDDFFIHPDV